MSDVNPSQKPDDKTTDDQALERERYELLKGLTDWLETPMLLLAFVWLALLVLELIWGESVWFETIGALIWIVFILDFVLAFIIAPRKLDYLRANWLTAVALLIPAVRLFRVFRVLRLLRLARVGRGMRLLRVLTSLNRGMRAWREPEPPGLRLCARPDGDGHVRRCGGDVLLREREHRWPRPA